MNCSRSLLLVVGISLALASPLAISAEPEMVEPEMEETARDVADVDMLVMGSDGFLNFHPDLRHRLSGQREYQDGNFAEAFKKFKRAARFADKPSQGMVAEMLWEGKGVDMDRPAAYIWMDLAAERGYKMMLVKREQYWADLTAEERERALEIGDALYLDYADKYAQPRLESRLRQARMQTTGSRTGFAASVRIEIPTPTGTRIINGKDYYQEQFWKADQYWAMQDSDWKYFGEGKVEVGSLQSIGDVTAPKQGENVEGDGKRM